FGQIVERNARVIARCERELRVDQFAGIQADQFAILLLIVRDGCVRQPLQAGAEAALWPARPPGNTAELSLIPGEEADDQVCFAKGISLQDKAFAHSSGHSATRVSIRVAREFWTAPDAESCRGGRRVYSPYPIALPSAYCCNRLRVWKHLVSRTG